jgi:SAM-dependent methyltransferase
MTGPSTRVAAEPELQCCCACGGERLASHLRVAGDAGPDGLIPTTDRFGSALADLVRCQACGHIQLQRFPRDEFFALAYEAAESEVYVDEEAGQRESARRALAQIERHAGIGSMLDLGCWVGFLLAEARQQGWETLGVEPSRFASDYAREKLKLDVETADLFAADLRGRRFDAVVLGDVIEHLPHPGRALEQIRGHTADDGVLHLTLPDAGSRLARAMGARWWSVIPTHVQYFTRNSISVLLARHGWQVLEVNTAPKVFSVRYYLERIGGYSPAVAGGAVRLATRAGLAERMWAPDFRDRMAVVARRCAAAHV